MTWRMIGMSVIRFRGVSLLLPYVNWSSERVISSIQTTNGESSFHPDTIGLTFDPMGLGRPPLYQCVTQSSG